jgi:translation initiation factor 2 beta subunit (eIF-2beta)/eIF-5
MNPTDTNLPIQENENGEIIFDFSKMKKRKSKNKRDATTVVTDEPAPNYEYSWLLARLYANIVVKDQQEKLYPNAAQVHNQNKITSVTNFDDIVKSIRIGNTDDLTDSKKHFANYLLSELSCGGYFSNSTLVLSGKFAATRIDNVCLKYIDIHIRCLNCKKFNTVLFKNTDVRKYAIECGCGAKRILPIVVEKNLENKKKK